jgi:hypothetical protein
MLVISSEEGLPRSLLSARSGPPRGSIMYHLFVLLPCERLKVSKVWESNVAIHRTQDSWLSSSLTIAYLAIVLVTGEF